MTKLPDDPVFGHEAAAQMLGISVHALRMRLQRGTITLQPVTHVGRCLVYSAAQVQGCAAALRGENTKT